MIAYHFYAMPAPTETFNEWQYTLFNQADGFLNTVHNIEDTRKRLSPETRVDLDELGVVLPGDTTWADRKKVDPIPDKFWNLSSALYAYLYIKLAKEGIDIAAESQYLGFPDAKTGNELYASIPLVDWRSGKPNARFRVLQLLKDNFGPGDQLIFTGTSWSTLFPDVNIAAQAFRTTKGKKLLLLNKRSFPIDVDISRVGSIGKIAVVDANSAGDPSRVETVSGGQVHLEHSQ